MSGAQRNRSRLQRSLTLRPDGNRACAHPEADAARARPQQGNEGDYARRT
jgi:hypothetical protein